MKEHLEKLLLVQFKQECLFRAIEKKGVNLTELTVDNLEIVLDMVGFPQDNGSEYDYDHLNSNGRLRNEKKKLMDNDFFCRDWLTDKWYELTSDSDMELTFSGYKGYTFQIEADAKVASEKIAAYTQWLYDELEGYEKDKLAGLAQ